MDKEAFECAAGPSNPGGAAAAEAFECAAGPSNPGGAAAADSGSEMDPEDKAMETKFFETLHGLMYNMNIQEKGAFTEQEQREYESLPSAQRFLEINPPIPIGENFSLDPSDGVVTLGIGEDTATHELDFTEDLSEDKWNFIDELLIEYVRMKERSMPQCSVPASTDIKADEIVSTGSSAKETSGENVTPALHTIGVDPIKDDAAATSDNKPTTSFEPPQSTSDIKTEDEETGGKIFDDNYPLTDVPQYFDKIVEINGERFVQKTRLLCFVKNDIVEEGKESGKQKHTKDSVPSPCEKGTASKNKKKRRKAKKKTDGDRKQDCTESKSNIKDASASSNLGLAKDSEGSSMADFECNAKNKVVKETPESKDIADSKEGEKGAIESDAKNKVIKETSESKDIPDSKGDEKGAVESDATKAEETLESQDIPDSKDDEKGAIEGDGKNKAVEEISEPKDIPDSKGDDKGAIESDATKVEETLESQDTPDSKDDEKGAIEGDGKNKVVEEISEPKDIPDSKGDEKDAIESDAKKVEETLETKDISDSKDDEKSAIEGDSKNKVVEKASESKDIPDLKDNEKGDEEEPTRLKQEKTPGNSSQTSKSRKKRKKKKTSKK